MESSDEYYSIIFLSGGLFIWVLFFINVCLYHEELSPGNGEIFRALDRYYPVEREVLN